MTNFCPQCVVDAVNNRIELADEIEILHDPQYKSDIKFVLCSQHKKFNLFTTLQNARKLTERIRPKSELKREWTDKYGTKEDI